MGFAMPKAGDSQLPTTSNHVRTAFLLPLPALYGILPVVEGMLRQRLKRARERTARRSSTRHVPKGATQ